MPTQQYTLTELNKTVSPGFTIKQIKIENPTPFYIYINDSSNQPTNTNAVYTVQPNSTFTTPEITTTDISIMSSGLNVSKGVAKLTIYSVLSQQASNLPYMTSQFVGNFPNYPYVIPATDFTFAKSLPEVNIERFQNIYFQVSTTLLGSSLVREPTFIDIQNNINTNPPIPIGGFSLLGGIKSYAPISIPSVIYPTLYSSPSALDNYEKVVNVIQTTDELNTDLAQSAISWGADGTLTTELYGQYVDKLGFMFSMSAACQNVPSYVLNLTLEIYARAYNEIGWGLVKTLSFNGSIPNLITTNEYVYIFKGKLVLLNNYSAIKFVITNNNPNPANDAFGRIFVDTL